MTNKRFMTASICALLLGGMVGFHAFCDTTAVTADGVASGSTYVIAEASETDESPENTTDDTTGYTTGDMTDDVNDGTAAGQADTAASGTGAEDDGSASSSDSSASTGALNTAELFTSRDLEQEADLSEAQGVTVSSGEIVTIKTGGVYVITGTATDAQILVTASDEPESVKLSVFI